MTDIAKKNRFTAKLALLAVAMAFVVIALGAFTRLVDAGLGCPDWPTCYGHVLWPKTEGQIEAANQVFDETPVEMDKTWPEQVHRIFASNLGLVSLILFGLAVRNNGGVSNNKLMLVCVTGFIAALIIKIALKATWDYGALAMHDIYDILVGLSVLAIFAVIAFAGVKQGPSQSAVKLSAFIVGFVVLQGLFGMWTVTLKVWPQVVTLHLLGGFTVAALFFLLALRLQAKPWQVTGEQLARINRLKPIAMAGLLIVFIQIALGGWTTSNYAAVACPDLPTCQHQMWPEMNFKKGFNIFQEIGPNYLGGQMENAARVAIHMSHRIGAIITTVFILFLFVKILALESPQATRLGFVLVAVLLTQIALGLGNIIFHFPLSVAVLHNGVGALLLLTLVALNQRIKTAILSNTHGEA
jgi:cytochrome c oxidase assembly protein subunit 15